MKLHYYPEADSFCIELKGVSGVETREIAEGLLVELDVKGEVAALDIDHASRKLGNPAPKVITTDVAFWVPAFAGASGFCGGGR
jgi:uncharacterized protein YuzE